MANNKVQLSDGTVLIDLSQDTVTSASDIVSGKVGHLADGSQVTGTASGGGGSSWTKVAETSYQVNTTSTTPATVDTWATGHSEIWTSDKIVYIRIRDTAGKRAGYFFGSDNYFHIPPVEATSNANGARFAIRYTSGGNYEISSTINTTGYGVFIDTIYNDGGIRIRKRYNSSYSLTVNGTYKVEVYLLDPPTGSPIFT